VNPEEGARLKGNSARLSERNGAVNHPKFIAASSPSAIRMYEIEGLATQQSVEV
jgi:hypothetical protein